MKGMIALRLRRYGQGEETAGLAYLAGPEAACVSGACLTVDGGYSV